MQRIRSSRKFIPFLVLGILIFIVLLGAISWWYFDKFPDKFPINIGNKGASDGVTRKVCSDKLIAKYSRAVEEHDLTVQYELAREVIEIPGFEDDINCNYIATQYAIRREDATEAKRALERIKKMLNGGATYSRAFRRVHPPDVFDSIIESIRDEESAGIEFKYEDEDEVWR